MIAAIYARKSTGQNSPMKRNRTSASSPTRAPTRPAKRWTVAEAHVYADDGISGAEFGDRRPGLRGS